MANHNHGYGPMTVLTLGCFIWLFGVGVVILTLVLLFKSC